MNRLIELLKSSVDGITDEQATKIVAVMQRNGHVNFVKMFHEECYHHYKEALKLYLSMMSEKKARGEAIQDTCCHFQIKRTQVYSIIREQSAKDRTE